MSYTPGPWVAEDSGDAVWRVRVAERQFGFVAQSMMGNDEANARLIAAAPEMLEALKWCVRHLEQIAERDWPNSDAAGRRFNSTKSGLAAIAKATGGAE